MSNPSNPLRPTFEGLVASTFDSLVLFEACLSGRLTHVPRRPHDRERQDLIKSGNVFIYEEHASGIKRWTDGVSWSPSRILGNFLIYRELEKPFPPGEKKRALKRKKCPPGGIGKMDSTSHLNMSGFSSSAAMDGVNIKDTERALIGSLIDSYPFKPGGLVKKTISVNYNGVPHHLVSYYNVDDAAAGHLATPSRSYGFTGISPRNELLVSQNFRAPIDEVQYSPDDEGGGPSSLITVVNAPTFPGGSHAHMPRAMSIAGFHAPVPGAYGSIPYTYHPQHQYLATMNSSLPVQMPQPLPSSIPPSLGSSAPPSIPPSISPAMPSSTPSISYTHQPHGNYSLGPARTSRFSASTGMDNEFPRTMPLHDPPRRSSAFELTQPPELSSLHLGSVPGSRPPPSGNTFVGQGSYYVPQRTSQIAGQDGQAFNQPPRPTKQDPNTLTGAEAGTQHYGLDHTTSDWALAQSEGQGDLQYFGTSANNGSEQWPSGTND